MNAAPRGYAAIKALASAQRRTLKDLLVLTPKRDPFYVGTPAQVEKAQWFVTLWERFAFTARVHLRRVHYRVMSPGDIRKADGTLYENTERDWDYLQEASAAARYLGFVNPLAFEDHRNPQPQLPFDWGSSTPDLTLEWHGRVWDWTLPTIQTTLADDVALALPSPRLAGYDYTQRDQPYHLELWVEKSTMNDVLRPFRHTHGAVLVSSVGFQSITSAVQLVAERLKAVGKPTRIFYLSDFDPAGDHMPVALARQIEFWLAPYVPHADIKLTPLVLTREQVQSYRLPRIPIKESDARKAGFEDRHGEGAVELDALEALYPGELAALVRQALDPYWDPTLADRFREAAMQAQVHIEEIWDAVMTDLREELAEIEADTQAIYARYQHALEQLNDQLADELAPYRDRLLTLRDPVWEAQDAFTPTLPERPQPQVQPGDESTWLYDSQRDYLTQLSVYKRHCNGTSRGDSDEPTDGMGAA